MLSDDEIYDHEARIHNELDPRDVPTHRRVDALIAQAREANALRAEVEGLRHSTEIRTYQTALADAHALRNQVAIIDKDRAEARQLLSLFGNQLAEAAKVVTAAMEFSDAYSHVGRVHGSSPLEASVHDYRLWLSRNPHVDHVGTVTVQPDGTVKT